MNPARWQWLKRLPTIFESPQREPAEHAERVLALQRAIILPARMLIVAAVFYHIPNRRWIGEIFTDFAVVLDATQTVLVGCALVMLAVTVLFYVVRHPPPGAVQWIVFTSGLADGIFLAGMVVITGGFDSVAYWVFPALIIVNALSIPLATPQIVLNLLLCIFYLAAGLTVAHTQQELSLPSFGRNVGKNRVTAAEIKDPQAVAAWLAQAPVPARNLIESALGAETNNAAQFQPSVTNTNLASVLADQLNTLFSRRTRVVRIDAEPGEAADPYLLRVAVLLLLTFCCYGMQLLLARQRRAIEERQEFLVRTEQLHSAGRVAAEVAHQIKNPLAIINNAAFSLLRGRGNSPEISQPLEIIREEVAKADRIITQLMGYAQLSEGRVEKLEVVEELNRAIEQVFPPAIPTGVRIRREYGGEYPPLLMQRRHLSESLVNLLQNARDALEGHVVTETHGQITVRATRLKDYSIEISVEDDGPGIPPDHIERIFEAYYTTKEKGTGLGLSMVKHNVELYGGTVRVESALGRGAKFVLLFPAKPLIRLGK